MSPVADRSAASWASKRPNLLEWLAAILLCLAALIYFVVVPLANVAVHGALRVGGAIVQGIAQGAAAVAMAGYEKARSSIESDPLVIATLGQPVVCQPPQNATFLAGQASDEFEMTFEVVGPLGRGQAHAVVLVTDVGVEITRLSVTSDGHKLNVPPAP